MKKNTALILMVLVIAVSCVSFGSTLKANVVGFPVELNGISINNQLADYPLLSYNNITYFPMTWTFSRGLGLTTEFDDVKGLQIKKGSNSSDINQALNGNNTIGDAYKVELPDFPISVNGVMIDNSKEQYPIFLYKGIAYFPLTWHYVVDEFGWTSEYSIEEGLKINSSKMNVVETNTEIIQEPSSNALNDDNVVENTSLNEAGEGNQVSGITLKITRVDLKSEEVDILNTGEEAINLNGYKLVSVVGNQIYTFSSYELLPNSIVTVYSGKGSGDLKWTGSYIWNNDGDPAKLFDPNNTLISEY